MARQLLLALDQGTTGSTALVMDPGGATLGRCTVDFEQHFPKPAWVEHDPEDIWSSIERATFGALESASIAGTDIAAIGVTNQRETTLIWDRATGKAIHRAIVWQDRRTSSKCVELKNAGFEDDCRERTGLVFDPYFSGTKVAWILDHTDGARARASKGELAFGTVDSFLIHRLSGGGAHLTDATNASRTLLMNLKTLAWDDVMLERLNVPREILPKIVGSSGVVAETRGFNPLPDGVPIAGIAGDQQAALFGQACFKPGSAKCTYGTGAFVLANIGDAPIVSQNGLLTTVAWKIGDQTTYAVEGSAFIAGAAVQWLRDGLGLIQSASEIEALARSVESSDGVVFVPALAGLGAPYWDAEARGLICGLTRGSTSAHLARAALDGIANQVADLVAAMAEDMGGSITKLRVDGGAAANNLLLEEQALLANLTIERPYELETTARGAAMLAAVGVGIFDGRDQAASMAPIERSFSPPADKERRTARRDEWKDAVARCRG